MTSGDQFPLNFFAWFQSCGNIIKQRPEMEKMYCADNGRPAGYLPKHTRQRLDSTHIIGVVKQMSQLECVSQTLRLALEELELVGNLARPAAWTLWWEH